MAVMKATRTLRDAPFGKSLNIEARAGTKVNILDTADNDWTKIELLDHDDPKPQGWVTSQAVDPNSNVLGPIDKLIFADTCAMQAISYGIRAHYLVSIAQMRTDIADGPNKNGTDYGPFALSPTEWELYRSNSEFSQPIDKDAIKLWGTQCRVFAVMTRIAQKRLTELLARDPTAAELALAQMIGTSATLRAVHAPQRPIADLFAQIPQSELDAEAVDKARFPIRFAEFLEGQSAKETIETTARLLQKSLDETKAFVERAGAALMESAKDSPAPDSSQEIAFGKKVSNDFKAKLIDMCARIGCDPNHMMAAMAFETGETFSPSKRNPTSGATGLIQFMPKTATGLGTSTAALAAMSAIEQLDFVEKYFKPHIGKLKSLSDVYMAILWPIAVGKTESAVLFARPSVQYTQNSGLDVNKDGQVTKGEATSKVAHKLQRGLSTTLRG